MGVKGISLCAARAQGKRPGSQTTHTQQRQREEQQRPGALRSTTAHRCHSSFADHPGGPTRKEHRKQCSSESPEHTHKVPFGKD
eukprot:292619-Amphidinium_carterae.1